CRGQGQALDPRFRGATCAILKLCASFRVSLSAANAAPPEKLTSALRFATSPNRAEQSRGCRSAASIVSKGGEIRSRSECTRLRRLFAGVPHLDLGDVQDKAPTCLVARHDNARKAVSTERLPIRRVGDHDLAAAKEWIDLAGPKHGLISIAARYDYDFAEDVVLDLRVHNNACRLQQIP